MTWTRFMDMHSGGGTKIPPYDTILIEAPEDAARDYFQKRFGRDPDHTTCSCCGPDYSVSQDESLEQATGYDRDMRCVQAKRGADGRYHNDDPNVRYLEEHEEPPVGYEISSISLIGRQYRKPRSVAEYLASEGVLAVRGDEVLAALKGSPAQ